MVYRDTMALQLQQPIQEELGGEILMYTENWYIGN